MSRLTPAALLLQNLMGKIPKGRREYLSPEDAYRMLKEETGQDFGYDERKWREWIKTNGLSAKKI